MDNDTSFVGMSDDAFEAMLNEPSSEVSSEEAPSEPTTTSEAPVSSEEDSFEEVDETPTNVEESSSDDAEEVLEEEEDHPVEDEADEEEALVEEDATIELTADKQLEELFKPLKASGRDITIKSVEEARKLISMGIDYSSKLQGFKIHRKTVKTLEENGIDSAKLNLLIDVSKGNKEAISKLIHEHGIDTMDLDDKEGSAYTPTDYSVSDSQVDMDDVISRIQGTASFSTTSDIVTNQWDSSSKEVILSKPEYLESLNEHVSNGTYDVVMNEVVRARAFGGLTGLTDFEAYSQVGKQLQSEGAFNKASVTKTVSRKPVSLPQANADKKKRASPTKGTPKKNVPVKYDYAGMSDSEFEKLLNN